MIIMSMMKELSINSDLVEQVRKEKHYLELCKKFTLFELEQVVEFNIVKRIKLIEDNKTQLDGVEISKNGLEISILKFEIKKINKAIAEIKKESGKGLAQTNLIAMKIEGIIKQTGLSKEQQNLIESIESSTSTLTTHPELTLEQLEFAKSYYNNIRDTLIAEKNKPENSKYCSLFDTKLHFIKTQIRTINKSFSTGANKIYYPEKSYKFLKQFYDLAKLQLDSDSFEKMKADALSVLH